MEQTIGEFIVIKAIGLIIFTMLISAIYQCNNSFSKISLFFLPLLFAMFVFSSETKIAYMEEQKQYEKEIMQSEMLNANKDVSFYSIDHELERPSSNNILETFNHFLLFILITFILYINLYSITYFNIDITDDTYSLDSFKEVLKMLSIAVITIVLISFIKSFVPIEVSEANKEFYKNDIKKELISNKTDFYNLEKNNFFYILDRKESIEDNLEYNVSECNGYIEEYNYLYELVNKYPNNVPDIAVCFSIEGKKYIDNIN